MNEDDEINEEVKTYWKSPEGREDFKVSAKHMVTSINDGLAGMTEEKMTDREKMIACVAFKYALSHAIAYALQTQQSLAKPLGVMADLFEGKEKKA